MKDKLLAILLGLAVGLDEEFFPEKEEEENEEEDDLESI